jgi:hypothetical protein
VIVDPEGSPKRLQPFIDITQWRVLKLEYVRPDTQQVLHMAFLRSAAEADLLSPGGTTPVVIEEMGIEGQARVLAVEPCPPLEQGEGELITATFMQEHIDVRLLKLEGLDQPIEVTGSHPVYSEDQHTFVPVKDLGRGERLRTRTGTAVVESILRKPGSWRVYNLEIGSVHRYYVSQLDVLVHTRVRRQVVKMRLRRPVVKFTMHTTTFGTRRVTRPTYLSTAVRVQTPSSILRIKLER